MEGQRMDWWVEWLNVWTNGRNEWMDKWEDELFFLDIWVDRGVIRLMEGGFMDCMLWSMDGWIKEWMEGGWKTIHTSIRKGMHTCTYSKQAYFHFFVTLCVILLSTLRRSKWLIFKCPFQNCKEPISSQLCYSKVWKKAIFHVKHK